MGFTLPEPISIDTESLVVETSGILHHPYLYILSSFPKRTLLMKLVELFFTRERFPGSEYERVRRMCWNFPFS